MTLQQEFAKLEKANAGKSIAAYLDPPGAHNAPPARATLYYHVSTDDRIPSAARFLDSLEDSRVVYTNLARDHWLTTYMNRRLLHMDKPSDNDRLKPWHRESVNWEVAQVKELPSLGLRVGGRFLGDTKGPIEGGGLGTTARTVGTRTAALINAGSGRAKGLERALRYYALTAYAVISRARYHSTMLGNYVGAIMVNDTGRIIGWGFNSKSYHHAEVNLMLAYFQANPGAAKMPANATVFSSLTPCKQCATLLETARGDTNTVFYGQYDGGDFGKAGAEMSSQIDKVTKPVSVGGKPARTFVADTLTGSIAKGSIASAIGESKEAAELIDKTLAEIGRRAAKDRATDSEEQKIKAAVLAHIKDTLDGISI